MKDCSSGLSLWEVLQITEATFLDEHLTYQSGLARERRQQVEP